LFRSRRRAWARIGENHAVARLRRDLGDAAAHRPRANDTHQHWFFGHA
jgi:hypothetical protein